MTTARPMADIDINRDWPMVHGAVTISPSYIVIPAIRYGQWAIASAALLIVAVCVWDFWVRRPGDATP